MILLFFYYSIKCLFQINNSFFFEIVKYVKSAQPLNTLSKNTQRIKLI